MDANNLAHHNTPKKHKAIRAVIAFIVAWLVIIGVVLLAIKFWPHPSPVPADIKSQVKFSILYPKKYTFDSDGWNYQTTNNSLTIKAKRANYQVTLTEQKVPLAYQNDTDAYNRFIGTLKPSANFEVPLGTVSIANFVTAGDYQVVGETAILNAKGTLLLAHPSRTLSDDEWRDLFSHLAVD